MGAVVTASRDFPACDEFEFAQHVEDFLLELKKERSRPRRTKNGLPQSREQQRACLASMSLDFPFPCEPHPEDAVRIDLSSLNRDEPLVLIVDQTFFDTLKKVGRQLVVTQVRGVPRLYVRSLASSQRDTWLADLVATRKHRGWHAGFNRCVHLRHESTTVVDYRGSNVYVSWLDTKQVVTDSNGKELGTVKDFESLSASNVENDPSMELGGKYAGTLFNADNVTTDPTWTMPTRPKGPKPDGNRAGFVEQVNKSAYARRVSNGTGGDFKTRVNIKRRLGEED